MNDRPEERHRRHLGEGGPRGGPAVRRDHPRRRAPGAGSRRRKAPTRRAAGGVPYDGKLTKADGKGMWWEGLDPQDLYAQNHSRAGARWDWNAAKGSSTPDQAYCSKFFNRTVDLIDKYQPDLLYFDDSVLPLYPVSDVGPAHRGPLLQRQHRSGTAATRRS